MNLPNLIIAGVNKAGTTSLFSYLAKHPDIATSDVKETCFFLPHRYGEPTLSLSQYAEHFKGTGNNKFIMESTPGYFYGGLSMAELIDNSLPDVHVIIVLREPVERLISFYKFKKSMLELDSSVSFEEYFNECLKLSESQIECRENNRWYGLQGGLYDKHIDGWFDIYKERLKVVFFDDLRNDATLLVKDICGWLGLNDGFYDQVELTVENRTRTFRNSKLQKLAIWANQRGEKFFRKNPKVKSLLRNTYQIVNSQEASEEIGSDLKLRAREFYAAPNKRLAEILKCNGYADLPKWLM